MNIAKQESSRVLAPTRLITVFALVIAYTCIYLGIWLVLFNFHPASDKRFVAVFTSTMFGVPLTILFLGLIMWGITKLSGAQTSFRHQLKYGSIFGIIWCLLDQIVEIVLFNLPSWEPPGILGTIIQFIIFTFASAGQFYLASTMTKQKAINLSVLFTIVVLTIWAPIFFLKSKTFHASPQMNLQLFNDHFLFLEPSSPELLKKDAEELKESLKEEASSNS